MSAGLISILGPPAVGKTTVAERLAEELPAGLIYEDYAGNPFLAESYLGRDAWRLPAQLYYVMSRVKQLALATWPKSGLMISDYAFCQDAIYAAVQVPPEEKPLYDQVAAKLAPLVKPPDLAILLDAPAPMLLERIANRGRAFEKAMSEAFIDGLRHSYDAAVEELGCPLIRIDCRRTDLRRPGERSHLLKRIRECM